MSRVSSRSQISPSVTNRSNSIDLGKNSNVDMGSKSPVPSVTSGGIGVSQEVTNIGGVTVTGGARIDISPINLGVEYDPSANSLGIAAGAEIPGGLLGVSGGAIIDLNTGEVIGGSIGGEALGLGVNISNSKEGGIGLEFTVQIPFTPIEISLGFGFSPKKLSPTPAPPPTPSVPPIIKEYKCSTGSWKLGGRDGDETPDKMMEASKQRYIILSINPNHYGRPLGADPSDNSVFEPQDEGFAKFHLRHSLPYTTTIITDKSWRVRGGNWYWNGNQRADSYYQAILFCVGLKYTRYTGTSGQVFNGSPILSSYFCEVLEIKNCPPCPTGEVPLPVTDTAIFDVNPLPFPNPPPRKRNVDECCRETTKLLRDIHKRLGISKFPGQLPSTIIQEVQKEGEAPPEPSQVPIEDFVDLLNWQFERDDERWGQWKVEIDIEDSDITEDGAQKKSIKFPNLAESIAEFEGQLLSIMTNVDALVALQVKNLAESGMARQEAIKGYLAAKAIIKYMAFKSTEVDIPVPMTFTAGAETISALLEESEGHIKGTDYVEKETLRDVYLDLLQAAAIIRAVHWQRIDTKLDTKPQLLSILKGSVDLAASIAKPQKQDGDGNENTSPSQDFEDFIDSVEDGFRNTTGITDIQNPYGKTPDRRPRIRQIGDNISQAGGDN